MHSLPRHGLVASAAIAVVATLSFPSAAAAQTSHVVRPGQSIQAAVDAAAPGDTITIKGGTYHESVAIQKDGLTLRGDGTVTIMPPANGAGLCNQPGEMIGICVLPADINLQSFTYQTRVKDVRIAHLRVVGFNGDGIFAFGSQNLNVYRVTAVDNGGYGVARFDGIGGSIRGSRASGSEEAGFYVGDSPAAHAVVRNNTAWNNGIGVFVRHVHFAQVDDNVVKGNCIGIFLLDDGQPEGSGDNKVRDNVVRDNNRQCAGDAEEGIPPTSGGGVVLLGSTNNVVRDNTVTGNSGTTLVSGGIALLTSPFSGVGSSHNRVVDNRARNNAPADLVQDAGSTANMFHDNACVTSSPSGLC